ncbi:MAG TPA: hypothetical protein VGD99_25750, partial [Anaerolineae bacterium]
MPKKLLPLSLVLIVLGLLAACGGAAPQPETITVVETVVVKEEVEKVVTVEVEKVVTVEVEVAAEEAMGDKEALVVFGA